MSDGGKGSARRPGTGYQANWSSIFKPVCTRCGGAHRLSECKWPLMPESKGQPDAK